MGSNEALIRVRYAETDQMGVAYYANYFVWFEVGRNELFRGYDLPYGRLEKEGIFLPVISARCTYKRPARYDDQLRLITELSRLEPTRLLFVYRLFREEELIAHGETEHAFVNSRGKPVSLKRFSPPLWASLQNAREKSEKR